MRSAALVGVWPVLLGACSILSDVDDAKGGNGSSGGSTSGGGASGSSGSAGSIGGGTPFGGGGSGDAGGDASVEPLPRPPPPLAPEEVTYIIFLEPNQNPAQLPLPDDWRAKAPARIVPNRDAFMVRASDVTDANAKVQAIQDDADQNALAAGFGPDYGKKFRYFVLAREAHVANLTAGGLHPSISAIFVEHEPDAYPDAGWQNDWRWTLERFRGGMWDGSAQPSPSAIARIVGAGIYSGSVTTGAPLLPGASDLEAWATWQSLSATNATGNNNAYAKLVFDKSTQLDYQIVQIQRKCVLRDDTGLPTDAASAAIFAQAAAELDRQYWNMLSGTSVGYAMNLAGQITLSWKPGAWASAEPQEAVDCVTEARKAIGGKATTEPRGIDAYLLYGVSPDFPCRLSHFLYLARGGGGVPPPSCTFCKATSSLCP